MASSLDPVQVMKSDLTYNKVYEIILTVENFKGETA